MIRWLIWTGYIIFWTIALEAPVADTGMLPGGELIETHRVLMAKSVHISVYVLMAILSAWVRTPARFRWLMMAFLMVHATGSEMWQVALEPYCHRTGLLTDVVFDNVGILIGILVSWKWWTRPDPAPPIDHG